jgi:hypothetical protein
VTLRRIATLAVATFLVPFAACSSSAHSASSTTSTRAATPTTGESTPSTGSTSTTLPAKEAKSATPNCTFAQLAVTATGDSAAGHIGVLLRFENVRTRICNLTGYPGVAALDAAGRQVIQAVRTLHGFIPGVPTGQRPPVVILAGGQSASAFVEGTDVPEGNDRQCPTYPKLLVTPPNTRQSVTVDMSMPGCSPVQVHPVVPGTSGALTS